MSPNKRIVLNIIATYGRSLYALVLGLFTARWVLMALGETDYGLYGVVGGLTGFVIFISYILQGATSRFYAFNIGKAQSAESSEVGIEECRKWFNTSLAIHLVIPAVLVLCGYILGDWAVREFLTIPEARVSACRFVFAFACLSCWVTMLAVPFLSLYIAKQYIAELTIYNFVTTTLNAVFVYVMVTHPRDWLVAYAAWAALIVIVPQIIIAIRAMIIFPECRIRVRYWWNVERFKELLDYAGWNVLGGFGAVIQNQGSAVLVNKFFGPSANAGYAVAAAVNQHCSTLVAALRGAFIPAITTVCGKGDYERMNRMALRTCKMATVLSLVFMLPLALELSEIIRIWLKTPPPYVVGLCWCMMAMSVVENLGLGHSIAISAKGRVARYQVMTGVVKIATLPVSLIALACGANVYAVGFSFFSLMCVYTICRARLAKKLVGLNLGLWIRQTVLPSLLVCVITLGVGSLCRLGMSASFARVVLTTLVSEAVFIVLTWFVMLDAEERLYIFKKMKGCKQCCNS